MGTDPTVSPYTVLGCSPSATTAQLKARYRALAKEHHPDQVGDGGARRMAEINLAYTQLISPAERARVDQEIMQKQHASRVRSVSKAHAAAMSRSRRLVRRAAAVGLGVFMILTAFISQFASPTIRPRSADGGRPSGSAQCVELFVGMGTSLSPAFSPVGRRFAADAGRLMQVCAVAAEGWLKQGFGGRKRLPETTVERLSSQQSRPAQRPQRLPAARK